MRLFAVLMVLFSATVVHGWTTFTFSSHGADNAARSITSNYPPSALGMSSSNNDGDVEYSVRLGLPPLGIVFEDIGTGFPPKGVEVIALTAGGKGFECGKIEIGDKLKTCSAVKFLSGSSNFDIVEVDCTKLDFDTVVSALTSNSEKFGCDSVSLTFTRPTKQSVQTDDSKESEENA